MTNIDFDHQIILQTSMMYSVHSRDGIASEKGIIACGDDEELQKFKRKYLLFSMDLEKIMISKHATFKENRWYDI